MSKAPTPSLELDQQLCFALYATSLAMTRLYKPHLQALGLTYPQYLVMMVLWETESLAMGTLGERLFLDSGTLTPLLKRMETSGWLLRRRDAADERHVQVSLTPAGRQLRRRALALPAAIAKATGCTVPQLQTLTRQLHAMRASLHLSSSAA